MSDEDGISVVGDRELDAPSGTARSYLLTVLGELAWPEGGRAWTASLLHVMQGLGIEERSARQAIARAAKAGWLVAERHGRSARWTLTPRLIHAFEEGTNRVASLSEPFDDWDEQWLVLVVTIPQDQRDTRKRLYRRLTWAGFGTPWAGLWLTPHTERAGQVADILQDLDLRGSSVAFRGRAEPLGLNIEDLVARSWDLAAIRAEYAAVDNAYSRLAPASGDDMLLAHVRALEALQRFPFRDPQLPESLLPDWIGRRVAAHLQARRAQWASQVRARWREIEGSAG